jgi:hypothetical protein
VCGVRCTAGPTATTTLTLTRARTLSLGTYSGTLIVIGAFTLTLSEPMGGALTAQGGAALVLSGSTPFAGAVTLTAGSLTISGVAVSSAVTLGSDATIALTTGSFTGAVAANAFVLTVNVASGQEVRGSISTSAGSVNVTGAGVVRSAVNFNAAGTLAAGNPGHYSGTVTAVGGVPIALSSAFAGSSVIDGTTVFTTPSGVVGEVRVGTLVYIIRRPVTAIANGRWDVATTWTPNQVPTAGTDVKIGAGFIVSAPLTGTVWAANLLILENGGRLNFAGKTLQLIEALQCDTAGSVGGRIEVVGTLSVGGTLSVNETTGSVLNATSGGSISSIHAISTATVLLSGGTFTLSGVWFGATTRVAIANAVTLSIVSSAVTVPTLSLSGAAALTLSLTSGASVTATAFEAVGSNTLTGALTVGSGGAAVGEGSLSLSSELKFDGGASALSTITAAYIAAATGAPSAALTFASGKVNANGLSVDVPVTVSGGELNGTITVMDTRTVTVSASAAVAVTQSLSVRAVALGSATLSLGTGATLTVGTGAALTLGAALGALTVSGSGRIEGAGALALAGVTIGDVNFLTGAQVPAICTLTHTLIHTHTHTHTHSYTHTHSASAAAALIVALPLC